MRSRYPDWVPVVMLVYFLVAMVLLLGEKVVEWMRGF